MRRRAVRATQARNPTTHHVNRVSSGCVMLPLPVMAVRSIMLAACVGSMDAKEANGAGIVETIPVSSVSAISIMDSNCLLYTSPSPRD